MADDLIARLKYWGDLDGAVPQGMKRDCALAARALESALSELARLRGEREVATPVIRAACLLAAADTYKHPVLSRADAVKAGVAELHDAVQRWQSAQPAQRQIQSHEEKQG